MITYKEYVGKSKYKYVNTWLVGGWVKFCDSEIEQGKEPVNILVRKSV